MTGARLMPPSSGTVVSAVFVVLASIASLALWACRSASPPVDAGCSRGSVIAFGDSITFGAGLSRAETYPAQLATLVGNGVCNAGVNGDTAKDGLGRLQRDALRFHPSAVVILFGANDSGLFASQGKKQVPLTDYRKQLESIVAAVKSSGARPVLATLTPMNSLLLRAQGLQPDNWAQYDAAIRTLASSDNVTLVDLGAAFGGNLSLLQDGIHPTAEGAALMAQAVFSAIGGAAPPSGVASPTP